MTFYHLNLHFCFFFILVCSFCHLNLHFCVFFTIVCDFLSPKFTFLCLFYTSLWLFVTCIYIFVFNFFNKVILKVYLNVSGLVKYNLMRASSYLPLRKELKAKQGCLNIQNNDEKCFLWSIPALLHPVQPRNHLDRVSKYQEYEHELNMSGIQYPVDIKDICKFEQQNNISVRWVWR